MDKVKRFNITNRISKQARDEFKRIVATHEIYAHSFNFFPKSTAKCRRKSEELFAKQNPNVVFILGDKILQVTMSYFETCHNVNYKLLITINGEKKDIRFLKKIFNR